jgi:hypothetical protein
MQFSQLARIPIPLVCTNQIIFVNYLQNFKGHIKKASESCVAVDAHVQDVPK